MTKDEALRLALEALNRGESQLRWEAIAAIEEALAQPKNGEQCHDCGGMGYQDGIGDRCPTCNGFGQQPEQEPSARLMTYIGRDGAYPKHGYTVARTYAECPKLHYPDSWEEGALLYTTPPKRTWVELTDDEFHDLQIENIDEPWANFKAIEAKLKEKNT